MAKGALMDFVCAARFNMAGALASGKPGLNSSASSTANRSMPKNTNYGKSLLQATLD
jgi:hypothetical protein